MASTSLRFRTPHVEELPTTQSRQAPGFAWVAVSGGNGDPSKDWGTTNRKRQRTSLGQTEQQKEALTAKFQREVERRINALNSDNSKDAKDVPIPKREGGGSGAAARSGKTTNTKKILASGKTFAHHLDDEEAEIARKGRRDGDTDVPASSTQRASKTPYARRKVRESSTHSESPAPKPQVNPPEAQAAVAASSRSEARNVSADEELIDDTTGLSVEAELVALLNAPPLTYNEARSAPPPVDAAPPRQFCETCGYWGRVRCMKCGSMVCSVACKDDHDQFKCLKLGA
ncbi:hypothetical protein KC363_g4261 [Hortaea werneckii]|uniref:HIT-type domain-containing protein n=1 Tax=Hortaea werneckii TaxID=91943 RepID=A0A3M7FNH2_HORWE|nr:hypothetical protein KC363_g4261 [Hortaea werneckii]KAI7504939.1 hypothetical protein KC347_g8161 [Hortaea werneckii]RMY90440.1 hypothetical protein D0861_03648 [Hortaea werneckii]